MAQVLDLPFIDDSEVFGPTLATSSKSIDLPFIDGGAVFAPTLLNPPAAPAPGSVYKPVITVWAGGALIAGTFQRSWRDDRADVGSFSFAMEPADFATSGLDFDDTIQIRLDGVPVFPGVIKKIEHIALAQGEKRDQIVQISGPGALTRFDEAYVNPSRGPEALPIEEVRTLSWVGADFDPAAAGWKHPKKVNLQRAYGTTFAPRPYVWPDITGWWIAPNLPSVTATDAPEGISLYRTDYTLAETKLTRHFLAPDNVLRAWLDGSEHTWFAGSAVGEYIEVEQGPGDHYVAVKVANKVTVPGELNPTGLIGVGYTVGPDGLLDEKLYETDTSWWCLAYPVRAPGFTDGKAMRILMQEAQAESALTGMGRDFTDTLATDGKEWRYQREISVGVGRKLTDILRERSDFAIDVAISSNGKKLRMWNFGDRGRTRNVTLQQTGNRNTSDFLELSHDGRHARLNRALIRYASGHLVESDSGSIGTHGSRGDYLEVGEVESETEARERTQALMAIRAQPSWSTRGRLLPRSAATTPYKAFGVADTINCPDENGDTVPMRVESLGCEEDAQGVLEWPIELRDKRYEMFERHDAWLRRSNAGFAVGGARISSRAGTPAPTAQKITTLDVAEFSMHASDGGLETGLGITRRAVRSGNGVEIAVTLTLIDDEVPTTTSTTCRVYLDGVELGSLITIPAGQTEEDIPLDIPPILANVSRLRPELVTVADEVAGIDIQVKAI